jgi:Zn finger protein HypA/HybF involved in hydrogenase expression
MIKHYIHNTPEVNKNMCSVGDAFNIEITSLNAKFYKCSDCKNEFRGVGSKVKCPSCHSTKVSLMFKEE